MSNDKEEKKKKRQEEKVNKGIWQLLFCRFDQLKDFKVAMRDALRFGFFVSLILYIIAGSIIAAIVSEIVPGGGFEANIEWWKTHGYVTILVCCPLGALCGLIGGFMVNINVPYLKEKRLERGPLWTIKRIYAEYFRKENERQIEHDFWAQRANARKFSTKKELNKEFAGFKFLFVFTPFVVAFSAFLYSFFAKSFTDTPPGFLLYSLSFGFTAWWLVLSWTAGGVSGAICKKCGKAGCLAIDEITERTDEHVEEREVSGYDETIGTVYVGDQAVGSVTQYHAGWTEQRTITSKYETLHCHCICCNEKTSDEELVSKEKNEWTLK